jgi:hypothetical protein
MPIFHVLGLLADMSQPFWVLPAQTLGGHDVSGFASRSERGVQVLLYSHHPRDTQSRSEAAFEIALDLAGLDWPKVRVHEYRFDKINNSYYQLATSLRDRPIGDRPLAPGALEAALEHLHSDDPKTVLGALKNLQTYGSSARAALAPLVKLIDEAKDDAVRSAAREALQRIAAPRQSVSRSEMERLQALAACRSTASTEHSLDADGHLRLTAPVAGNGISFLVIAPQAY